MHTFYRRCNNVASCNCAVAVRVGDDVIVLDKCFANGRLPLRVRKYSNSDRETAKGFRVTSSNGGKTYNIRLPNGALVKAEVHGGRNPFINVFMRPALSDRDSTEGLCGTYNKNPGDDLRMPNGNVVNKAQVVSFDKGWRVPAAQSIYKGEAPTGSTTYGMGTDMITCSCTPETNYVPGKEMQCPTEALETIG